MQNVVGLNPTAGNPDQASRQFCKGVGHDVARDRLAIDKDVHQRGEGFLGDQLPGAANCG